MENNKPSDRIIGIVKPYLIEKGFEFKGSKKDFVKKFQYGRQRFSLRFDGRGGLVTVNCGFFIYFDALIKLYSDILETETGDWSFQIGANTLKGIDTIFNSNIGNLFDDQYGKMSLSEKSKFSSSEMHPEYKIQQGANFIIQAFDFYVEIHFDKINNYESLYETLIHAVKIRNKTIPSATAFLNLNLRFGEENLLYYTLILALQLGKETNEINKFSQNILERYQVGEDKIVQNIQKIYEYHKIEKFKNRLK